MTKFRSACSVAASYKPPMLVTRVRLPACAVLPAINLACMYQASYMSNMTQGLQFKLLKDKVVPRGLEPRTLRLLAVRSNQLSYETSAYGACLLSPTFYALKLNISETYLQDKFGRVGVRRALRAEGRSAELGSKGPFGQRGGSAKSPHTLNSLPGFPCSSGQVQPRPCW